jgi:signal transduction histidine kinase
MAGSNRKKSHGNLADELRALAPDGQLRVFPPDAVIFSAGQNGDGLYVVESGSVRISAVVGDNEPRVLATIGPGDFFGEMAVVDDAPRSATATAETETRALFLDRAKVLQLIERRPQLALNIIREFSIRLRTLNQKYLDEILQAEQLAAVGRFAATIVHDFKNPLTVISVSAEIAGIENTTREMRQKAQHRIAQQVQRMSTMLEELIEFTKPSGQKLELRPISFADFMRPLIADLTDEVTDRNVTLKLENRPPALDVRIDPQRLSRVFYNLINNAVDEMQGGGTVFLRFFPSETELRIEFEDSGNGIAPEIAQSLFQPFATHGKIKGTGLGLSICKKIVEDHGGRIWAESVPGKGATFVFTLPLPR